MSYNITRKKLKPRRRMMMAKSAEDIRDIIRKAKVEADSENSKLIDEMFDKIQKNMLLAITSNPNIKCYEFSRSELSYARYDGPIVKGVKDRLEFLGFTWDEQNTRSAMQSGGRIKVSWA